MRPDFQEACTGGGGGDMVRRVIALLLLCGAATASAVSLKDLVARISASVIPASVLGGAVDLDGSTEYFSEGNSSLLNGATSMSLVVWCTYRPNMPDYAGLLVATGVKRNSLQARLNSDYQFTFYANSACATTPIGSAKQSTWTNWFLVVGVYQMSNSIAIYQNTSMYERTTNLPPISDSGIFRVGYDDYSTVRRWRGLVDDTAIYRNRALTSNEVVELYNGGIGKPVTSLSTGTNGLIRYWKFDDGLSNSSATQALDIVSGTYIRGTGIGSGDWTNGIVPQ